ncbi:RlpA-like double-psi beta-barrel-protein domain-containing protein-containing protein [Xylaria castorea]|nr:RlpA-like double-psi beta-barrel-protein domain-containing protein-containing protein [Xylaria castorea]
MQSFAKIVVAAVVAAATGLVSAAPATSPAAVVASRDMSGDLTYYAPGLGACGVYNSEDDAVVALSWQLFDGYTPNGNPNLNTLCGRQIQISLGGNSAVVTVRDRCQGCQKDDLDVPVKVFSQLADPDAGRVRMTWDWVS